MDRLDDVKPRGAPSVACVDRYVVIGPYREPNRRCDRIGRGNARDPSAKGKLNKHSLRRLVACKGCYIAASKSTGHLCFYRTACMQRGLSYEHLSVCPSVCLSVRLSNA